MFCAFMGWIQTSRAALHFHRSIGHGVLFLVFLPIGAFIGSVGIQLVKSKKLKIMLNCAMGSVAPKT